MLGHLSRKRLGNGLSEEPEKSFRNEINGVFLGSSLQAQTIYGGVHYHGSASITQPFEDAVRDLKSGDEAAQLDALRQLDNIEQQVPRLRQEIMNVLCDCLRCSPGGVRLNKSGRDGTGSSDAQALVGDLRVKRAIQQLIRKHLYEGTDPCGPDRSDVHPPPRKRVPVSVDLVDATLVDFDLSGCVLDDILLDGAWFVGSLADFRGTSFDGLVTTFEGAVFECPTMFRSFFDFGASFRGACFMDDVSFDGSVSPAMVSFRRAYFSRTPGFTEVDFFDIEPPDSHHPVLF